VCIALHPEASRYVGFRPTLGGSEHVRVPGAALPTAAGLGEILRAFESWLPHVDRHEEEQGVIRLLRSALNSQLALPELGEGWVFLHQEWLFGGTGGRRADVLAVQIATGQLGIVEFKSSRAAIAQARQQVEDCAELWERDAAELAPLFTGLLRAQAVAYGNGRAATATVEPGPAALFVGVASPSQPIRILAHARRGRRAS
jgi:hypothetical protein